MYMALTDAQRLARIDEEILDLEYLYTRELMREKELNKRNLLASNGFKYRIENLRRARAKFRLAMKQAPTKRMNYATTLAEKKNKLIEAEEELEYMNKQYKDLMVKVLLTRDDTLAHEAMDLASELKSQRMRVISHDRAVKQFIERGFLVQERELRARVVSTYKPEKDKSLFKDPEESEVRTVESFLNKKGDWDKKPENNAGDVMRQAVLRQPIQVAETPAARYRFDGSLIEEEV
jgi:hypothetical protein